MESSTEFNKIANRKLEELQDYIEDTVESAEVDLLDETLSVVLDTGQQYIINKHNPTQQIWVASPQSGAHHFRYDPAKETWVNVRNPQTLDDLLAQELKAYVS